MTLLEEFQKHANKGGREPTVLVSASDRIVDTLKRAFDKHCEDGESSAEVWIAFTEVPPTLNLIPQKSWQKMLTPETQFIFSRSHFWMGCNQGICII